jgi:type I restriction enzyme S subunit
VRSTLICPTNARQPAAKTKEKRNRFSDECDDEALEKGWAIVRDNWHTLSQSPEDVADLRRSVLELAVRGKLVPQKSSEEHASVLIKQIQSTKQELIRKGKIRKTKP